MLKNIKNWAISSEASMVTVEERSTTKCYKFVDSALNILLKRRYVMNIKI